MMALQVSIVIPTHNRRVLLEKTLRSLIAVEGIKNEAEIIVVDDGSSDDTVQWLQSEKWPFPLRLIRHAQPQGPAAARNAGIVAARGEIIGLLDSDVVVDPGWWQHAKPHFRDSHIAGVEGRIEILNPAQRRGPFTHIIRNQRGGLFLTCNIFFRKVVLEEVGIFDERFFWREDSDLAFSVMERGWCIIFEPKALAYHPVVEKTHWVFFAETRHAFYEALLRRRHPLLYRQKLKWIDGRAFPVFYWGHYLGLLLIVLGTILASTLLIILGAGGYIFGAVTAWYARLRKRKWRAEEAWNLLWQMLLLPWPRLFWVLRGEWHFRKVQAAPLKKDPRS